MITKDEFKSLKVGDRVLVEAEVTFAAGKYGVQIFDAIGLSPADIHQILPRPFAVGDRVLMYSTGQEGRILAIHEDKAWIAYKLTRESSILPLAKLSHVPRWEDAP